MFWRASPLRTLETDNAEISFASRAFARRRPEKLVGAEALIVGLGVALNANTRALQRSMVASSVI